MCVANINPKTDIFVNVNLNLILVLEFTMNQNLYFCVNMNAKSNFWRMVDKDISNPCVNINPKSYACAL